MKYLLVFVIGLVTSPIFIKASLELLYRANSEEEKLYCPYCDKIIDSTDYDYCPHCGANLNIK